MKWIKERDALIAQTMAFVQSVSGKKDDFRQPDTVSPAAPPPLEISPVQALTVQTSAVAIEPPQADPVLQVDPPPQPVPVPASRIAGDVRSEIQARVASFRKHQERFARERQEYCTATLSKLRIAIDDSASPPPAQK
jgi:hypothetical protein